jgi:hypothetical protein
VDRHHRRGEPAGRVDPGRAARGLERCARRQARLEVAAQGGAQRIRALERLASVAGHVAQEQAYPATGELEDVVEVPTRGRSRGGPVGHRDGQVSHPLGHAGQQHPLQQAHVPKQALPLAPERPRAAAVGVGTGEEGESEKREGAERDPNDARHDLDDPLDGAGDGPVVVLRG